jgi:hypothetical protein
MLGFRVRYDGYSEIFDSIVYAIDPDHEKFLVVNDGGWFKWVKCSDCQLIREEVSPMILNWADCEEGYE